MADRGDKVGEDPSVIMGHVADGDVWLRKALTVDAKHADARVLQSKVLRYQGGGDSQASQDLLKAVLADHPSHFDALWELGQVHFRAGRAKQREGLADWQKAEEYFSRCMQVDPSSGDAILNHTYARAWQGRPYAELAPGYEKAAILLPGRDSVLGQLYKATVSKPGESVAAFERVAAAQPDQAGPLLYLAYAHKANKDVPAGIEVMDRAVKVAPRNPLMDLNRGHLYFDDGNVDKALPCYEAGRREVRRRRVVPAVYNDIDGARVQDLDADCRAARRDVDDALGEVARRRAGLQQRGAVVPRQPGRLGEVGGDAQLDLVHARRRGGAEQRGDPETTPASSFTTTSARTSAARTSTAARSPRRRTRGSSARTRRVSRSAGTSTPSTT